MGPSTEDPAPPAASVAITNGPLVFRQVSAGGFHTCGVTVDDRAYCWGANSSNQLGDGTSVSSLTPVAVHGGLGFRSVSAGEYHTCGVATDGRAYCWGNNSAGELGDGTHRNRPEPTAVLGGLRFRQVDAGTNFTCGLRESDRRAYCWGFNAFGRLGDGTRIDRLRPVAVVGNRAFRQIIAGGFQACAIDLNYRAYCWGRNNYGQLGDGTEVSFRSRPALVAGGYSFRQIDGNRDQTCAVTTGDRAYCWGYGRLGQIGDGKMKLRFTPRAVLGGLQFRTVSTGVGYTCGKTTTNLAYCWGSNNSGQLGDGSDTWHLTPFPVAGGLSFVQISAAAGGSHSCGRTSTGAIYCWGSNAWGELGDGTTDQRSQPVVVVSPG